MCHLRSIIKFSIFIVVFFFVSKNLSATHIVGGEVTYTCLGDNNFEISLTVFRDCINGNPDAYFDDPASIGIFDVNNNLITNIGQNGQLLIPLMQDDTLDPVLSDPCLVVPPNVCVHTTTYRATLNLPFRQGGYQLAYQRCCRNVTINNIIEPLASGATFGVTITERALMDDCNSSAQFNEWPPLYICVNEPIFFDQSAFDTDNDSIVYKLCAPQLGATPTSPIPQPPNPPPYVPVNWVDPPYGVNNMLNGVPGGAFLQIDPNTGLLTGLPNTIGQFVVGICLEEYREDAIISTTRRDFQYNVGICGETVSAFFTPDVICNESLTVNLQNESSSADQFIWYFNDPANPDFFETTEDVTYSYSDTGTYQIMLIAEPGNPCVDTFWKEVTFRYPSLTPNFEFEFGECSDSLTIIANDFSIDSISNPQNWNWELFDMIADTLVAEADIKNPIFYVSASTSYELTLVIESENGCTQTISQTFPVQLVDEDLETDSILICPGSSVSLNPAFLGGYQYIWSPAESLDNANKANPEASPLETTTYSVIISDSTGTCKVERAITVSVPEEIELTLPDDQTTCETNFQLTAISPQGFEYLWATDDNFSTVVGEEASISVTPFGETTYYLLLKDEAGCILSDSVKINGQGVNINTSDLQLICDGSSVQLMVENLDMEDMLSYDWQPSQYVVSGASTSTPTIQTPNPGLFDFEVSVTNQFGCSTLDSVQVVVLDTTPQLDFVDLQQCSGFNVNFINTSINADHYQWFFGDPNNPTATSTETNPNYQYPQTGVYTVMLTYEEEVECPDTIRKEITINNPMIFVNFSFDIEECGDSVVVNFNQILFNGQSSFISSLWKFSNGETSTLESPTLILDEAQDLFVTLVMTSDDGCVDSLTRIVPITIIESTLADTIFICSGESTFLNPDFNPEYNYQWAPTNALDDPNASNPEVSPMETTTYTVTISDFGFVDTCQIIENITVQVPPVLDVSAGADQISCGVEVTLVAESNTSTNFEWSQDEDFNFIIGNDPELVVLPFASSTTYFVRVVDEFGCGPADMVIVENHEISIQGIDQISCIGDTVNLPLINLRPFETIDINWTPSTDIIAGQGTLNPTVIANSMTNYVANVSNDFGCTDSEIVRVNVFENPPDLDIDIDPDTLILGESAQIEADFYENLTYQWLPDTSLNDLNIYNPIATPAESTSYFLNYTNQFGCESQAEVRVLVFVPQCDEPYVFFPTAFSPNGDGENETLRLYGNPIDEAYWAIFNRWGEKVFETNDLNGEWDGTYKGKALSPDVFGYFLQVKCIDGQELFKKGNVTILR